MWMTIDNPELVGSIKNRSFYLKVLLMCGICADVQSISAPTALRILENRLYGNEDYEVESPETRLVDKYPGDFIFMEDVTD
jgi:hypothetical protein